MVLIWKIQGWKTLCLTPEILAYVFFRKYTFVLDPLMKYKYRKCFWFFLVDKHVCVSKCQHHRLNPGKHCEPLKKKLFCPRYPKARIYLIFILVLWLILSFVDDFISFLVVLICSGLFGVFSYYIFSYCLGILNL